ncbi:Single-stranded DNA-binding protein RIM1 mitochondrial [Spathaspora sp. JA1]|nr:Single-stranded DNA-binding protein RIM1 mitochondrial [Spathaspora sp. JA1]
MLRSFTRSLSASAPRLTFARATIVGNVGKFDFHETEKGVKYVRYALAVDKYAGKDNEAKEANWFNITAFDEKQRLRLEKTLRIGNTMFVEAHIQPTKYVAEDGKTIHGTSFIHRSFEVIRFGKKPADASEIPAEEESQ